MKEKLEKKENEQLTEEEIEKIVSETQIEEIKLIHSEEKNIKAERNSNEIRIDEVDYEIINEKREIISYDETVKLLMEYGNKSKEEAVEIIGVDKRNSLRGGFREKVILERTYRFSKGETIVATIIYQLIQMVAFIK